MLGRTIKHHDSHCQQKSLAWAGGPPLRPASSTWLSRRQRLSSARQGTFPGRAPRSLALSWCSRGTRFGLQQCGCRQCRMTGKLIGDRVPNPPELRNTISEWLRETHALCGRRERLAGDAALLNGARQGEFAYPNFLDRQIAFIFCFRAARARSAAVKGRQSSRTSFPSHRA